MRYSNPDRFSVRSWLTPDKALDISSGLHRCFRHIKQRLCIEQPVEGFVGCQQYILLGRDRGLVLRFLLQTVGGDQVSGVAEISN